MPLEVRRLLLTKPRKGMHYSQKEEGRSKQHKTFTLSVHSIKVVNQRVRVVYWLSHPITSQTTRSLSLVISLPSTFHELFLKISPFLFFFKTLLLGDIGISLLLPFEKSSIATLKVYFLFR